LRIAAAEDKATAAEIRAHVAEAEAFETKQALGRYPATAIEAMRPIHRSVISILFAPNAIVRWLAAAGLCRLGVNRRPRQSIRS
jgi:hypothetical protein